MRVLTPNFDGFLCFSFLFLLGRTHWMKPLEFLRRLISKCNQPHAQVAYSLLTRLGTREMILPHVKCQETLQLADVYWPLDTCNTLDLSPKTPSHIKQCQCVWVYAKTYRYLFMRSPNMYSHTTQFTRFSPSEVSIAMCSQITPSQKQTRPGQSELPFRSSSAPERRRSIVACGFGC